MKAGTPAGLQLDRAVKAILPASTSSLSFFILSFTQGFRFGLLRSAIRVRRLAPGAVGNIGMPRIESDRLGTARNHDEVVADRDPPDFTGREIRRRRFLLRCHSGC